jgi:alginate O-acetyltransferase complex protein AlgI
VAISLVALAYWKYTPLALETLAAALRLGDISIPLPSADNWFLPIGISFYTFTGIAYLVDIFRLEREPETNLLRFCLFITFFPQLVAGPILRGGDFLDQLQPDQLPRHSSAPLESLQLLACGYFKKMVLADRIALAIDPFFAHVGDGSTAGVWALPYIYLYALQIYFDFSGYTDIARGLGLMFGFRWPENFRTPYLASSIQDFWRRWHITLSTLLRDYLYIPLGGNRHGQARALAALMITMLLGGLWHGASWSFVVWGALHGVFLVVHKLWQQTAWAKSLSTATGWIAYAWRIVATVLTFHCVCLAWCFFRLPRFPDALAAIEKWFTFNWHTALVGDAADPSLWLLLAAYGCAAWMAAYLAKNGATWLAGEFAQGWRWGAACGLLLLALLLAPGGDRPAFIYFQF